MADNNVNVKFSADTADLESGVNRAASAIDGFGAQIYKSFNGGNQAASGFGETFKALGSAITSTLGGIGSVALGAFGLIATAAAASSAALGAVGAQAVKFGVDVGATADQLGETDENISRLVPIANAAGMSMDELGKKIAAMREKLRTGDEDTENALKSLKIDPDTFKGLGAKAQMDALNEALAKLGDSYSKTAAFTKLFGDATEKLLPVLNQTTEGYKKNTGEAERAGIVLSGPMIAAMRGTMEIVQQIAGNFREAGEAMQGLAITVYGAIKPAIDSLLSDFAGTTRAIVGFIEALNNAAKAGGQFEIGGTQIKLSLASLKDDLFNIIVEFRTYAAVASDTVQFLLAAVKSSGDGILAVLDETWRSVESAATRFFQGLMTSATETVNGIGQAFVNLGPIITRGLTADFSGAKAAFDKLEADAAASADKIKGAFAAPADASATQGVFGKMIGDMKKGFADYLQNYKDTEARVREQTAAEWSKPRVAPEKKGPNAGNPPDKDKDNSSEELQTQVKVIEGEIEAAKAAEKQKEQILDAGVKLHQISEAQKVAATQQALSEMFQAETDSYTKWANLEGMKPAAVQEVVNKSEKSFNDFFEKMQQQNLQAAEATAKTWEQATSKINSAVTSQVNGLLTGSETFGKAMKKVLTSLTEDIVKFFVDWALRQAETQAMNILGINAQVTATVNGAAAQTAAQQGSAAAGMAANAEAMLSSITKSAGAAFAGVAGFLAPVMGPAALGPAAAIEGAVMGAAVMSADIGAWTIPSDQLAMVHRNELVMPAAEAGAFRSMLSDNVSGRGNGGGGGDTHNHFSPTIHAQGFAANSKEMGDSIAKALKTAHRRGDFLGYNSKK
jgi:hypothetical protein